MQKSKGETKMEASRFHLYATGIKAPYVPAFTSLPKTLVGTIGFEPTLLTLLRRQKEIFIVETPLGYPSVPIIFPKWLHAA